ncbi:hypothetical protein [Cellulomonas humilata]|uniref:Uncharacterized protein n=1 Tax=Cellulomonas humilata TaxID=144055 RepID=A0ABU0EFU9_9CELL|nr:hypothetical protein [Cellulomonas humilata]MDQ0373926.1 hypothetical protein [Cellulomonas humilata]
MNSRRGLGELLSELADSVAALAVAADTPVRVRSIALTIPVDLRVASTETGLEVVADVPLFLTRTAFDPDPARLGIDWHAVPVVSEAAS